MISCCANLIGIVRAVQSTEEGARGIGDDANFSASEATQSVANEAARDNSKLAALGRRL